MGNILIADDDKNSRDSIQKVLEKEGHQVESAEDVDSALSALHRSRFDLVVCDYRMPGKSGADLLVELRKQRCSVPVLMISAHADDEAEESFREFGAMGLLRKPIRRRDLVLQTARVCGG